MLKKEIEMDWPEAVPFCPVTQTHAHISAYVLIYDHVQTHTHTHTIMLH